MVGEYRKRPTRPKKAGTDHVQNVLIVACFMDWYNSHVTAKGEGNDCVSLYIILVPAY